MDGWRWVGEGWGGDWEGQDLPTERWTSRKGHMCRVELPAEPRASSEGRDPRAGLPGLPQSPWGVFTGRSAFERTNPFGAALPWVCTCGLGGRVCPSAEEGGGAFQPSPGTWMSSYHPGDTEWRLQHSLHLEAQHRRCRLRACSDRSLRGKRSAGDCPYPPIPPHLLTCQTTGPEQPFLERFLRIGVLGDALLRTKRFAVTICEATVLPNSHRTFSY